MLYSARILIELELPSPLLFPESSFRNLPYH